MIRKMIQKLSRKSTRRSRQYDQSTYVVRGMRIATNKARCEVCSDMIESTKDGTDTCCSCGNLCVSGGTRDLHRSYDNFLWTEHSELDYV